MKIVLKVLGKNYKAVDLIGVAQFGADEKATGVEFKGADGETHFAANPKQNLSKFVLMIGLGKKEKLTLKKVRLAAAKVLAQAKHFKYKTVALDLDGFLTHDISIDFVAGAAVEGLRLSDYQFDKYKSKKKSGFEISEFILTTKESGKVRAIEKGMADAEAVSEGIYFTRNVANEPPNVMTPQALAKAAKEMAAKNNLSCKVYGKAEIKKMGMGGILGVSQGSSFDPQLIVLENRVTKPLFKEPIVLVGKGITFDTGGISIKPANDMDKMKFDMCGAAAVMGAMKAIANLKLPIKVVGITPVCENMPGSKAMRPGDIIKISNGKTVEVLNTDAEGRLILADALSFAKRFNPKALVDIATLTGACSVTFADLASGLMSTDSDLTSRLRDAGERAGERLWELPLWEEYGDLIKATYADIQNISKRYAGTITAGMFLKEFADHTKSWAHLDVAGTAWNEGGAKLLSPIGATGVGVRIFVNLVKSYL